MKTIVLTHEIRLSDGNVSPSHIEATDQIDAAYIYDMVKGGFYDTDTVATRLRRYPIERHLADVSVKEVW